MEGPVTLMTQQTLLVRKDQAGNQDAKKKRTPNVVRRWGVAMRVAGGVDAGWGFGIGIGEGGVGGVGVERGGRRGREGRERWRVALRRWRVGRGGRSRVCIGLGRVQLMILWRRVQ